MQPKGPDFFSFFGCILGGGREGGERTQGKTTICLFEVFEV
jgi:hypothetical protein